MRKTLLWICWLLILAACSSPTATPPAPTPTTPPSIVLPSQTSTPPVQPSATPLPARILLVVPPGADAAISAGLQSTLVELAKAAGIPFEAISALPASDPERPARLVVVLPPISGLAEVVSQSPQTQYVAVGIPGLSPSANLTAIGNAGFNPDQQAFLAGYIAAMVTPDWRVGILTVDSPQGLVTASAFANGARYFCGLCRPAFPPFLEYPQAAQAPETIDKQNWQPAADLLIGKSVQTVYIDPSLLSTELFQYLFDAKLVLLGGIAPSDALRDHWVATIRPDPSQALRDLWNDLLAGKGGGQLPMPLAVKDTQSGLLSAARQRLVQETLDGLVDGTINPNNIP